MTFTRHFEKFMDFDLTSSYSISELSEQNRIKLMCFVQMGLLNNSTRGLRNSLTESREIRRILSDILKLEPFEMHTTPHYKCIFRMERNSHDQSSSRTVMTSPVGGALSNFRSNRQSSSMTWV